jgi:hypothetical protein
VTATDMSIDLEMIADAAGVVAEAFGLGQQASPIDDWAIDDGDQVIGALVAGPDPFHVYLAVNVGIAGRLLSDHDRLVAGLTEAARSLVGATASFTIEEVGPTAARP